MKNIPTRKRNSFIALGLAALLGGTVLSGPVIDYARADNISSQITRQHAPQEGFADIVEKVMPAVVSVRVEGRSDAAEAGAGEGRRMPGMPNIPKDSPFYEFFRNMPQAPEGKKQPEQSVGLGSGFIISQDGYVVTNNHVVDKAENVIVTLDGGKEYKAKVVGTDPKTDLAVLKIESKDQFGFVTFAGDKSRVGDWVVAVGNPFGLGGTVTTGIISAQGREIGAGPYDEFMQIDAPINRGNSGGPTFNLNGEVVGVNTAIYSPSGGSVGIGFAIPANMASNVVESLIKNGTVTRGWLGVAIQPVSEEIADSIGAKSKEGALISQVTEGSPAAKAGLEVGDLVVSLDGTTVKDPRDLSRRVAGLKPDDKAKLVVLRDGAEKDVTVAIGHMEDTQQVAAVETDSKGETSLTKFGLKLAPSDEGDGVTITAVDPDGSAAGKGLRQGDRIVSVGGAAVKSPADVQKAIDATGKDKKSVLMLVKRGDGQLFVALPVTKS